MSNSFTTYSDYRVKVERDLDIQGESFIPFDELVGYANEAILEAAQEILKLHEEYFLASANISVTSGTHSYSLPADIFSQKIRAVISDDGSDIYEIKRIQRLRKFLSVHLDRQYGTDDTLRYFISHESASDGFQITFVPTPTFTSSTRITIWYIRDANVVPLSADGSESASNATAVDIPPEARNFVMAYMKEKVIGKEERGSPTHIAAITERERQKKMMVDTLTGRFLDDDDEVWEDHSHYQEHS